MPRYEGLPPSSGNEFLTCGEIAFRVGVLGFAGTAGLNLGITIFDQLKAGENVTVGLTLLAADLIGMLAVTLQSARRLPPLDNPPNGPPDRFV